MDDKFGISTKNRSRKNFQNLEYAEFLRSLNLLTLETYHWTLLRGPPRARVPSINLCVKKWNPRAPQRGGSSHSGEGQNRGFHLMKTERRGYKKIPLVEFEDIYKTITGPYRGDLPARGFLVLICV